MTRWKALPAFVIATLVAWAVWWWWTRPVPLVDLAAARVPCVSYAPYRDDQTPFDENTLIPPQQIEQDLRVLSAFTACVRTYATNQGLDAVPRLARAQGLSVLLGAWIGREPEKNARELARVVELANRYPETVKAVIVGNEVLLRREQPAERLALMIAETRARVPVPVTYADVWEFWEKNPQIAGVVDFVTIHTLPYWEDDPVAVEGAIAHVIATWQRIQAQFPGKRVFIGEAGWPSAGRMREGALPSPVNQARFVRELLSRAAAHDIGINLIEAFDQPWKRKLEGTVGGHWGLFTAARAPKFALAGAVAPDPHWQARFALAAGLALLALIATARSRRRGALALFGLALMFQVCASALVLAWADLAAAARTALAWGLGFAQLGLAAAAPVCAALVIASAGASPLPTADSLLAALRTRVRPAGPPLVVAASAIRLALAIAAGALTLALVFEPRYRDFPVALYAGPALALLAQALVAARAQAGRDRAGAGRGEEHLLAGLLAVGGLVVAVREGALNFQALGWTATVMALAAALVIGARRPPMSAAAAG